MKASDKSLSAAARLLLSCVVVDDYPDNLSGASLSFVLDDEVTVDDKDLVAVFGHSDRQKLSGYFSSRDTFRTPIATAGTVMIC